jgi:predicted Na+-dependent transporter
MDHNGVFVISAFSITVVVLGLYAAYLRSRLSGLRRRTAAPPLDQSARNVSTAAPMATTAQPANSPSGSSRS